MKYSLAIILVPLLASLAVNGDVLSKLNDEQKARALQMATECIAQEKTTKEAAMALAKGDFSNGDKNLKCYANCFLTKAGMMVDGVVQPAVVSTKMGPIVGDDKIKATLDKCGSIKGTDNCDTAFKLYECFHKEHTDIV